jgi:hypothetical protein
MLFLSNMNATVCARTGPRYVVYDQLFMIRGHDPPVTTLYT